MLPIQAQFKILFRLFANLLDRQDFVARHIAGERDSERSRINLILQTKQRLEVTVVHKWDRRQCETKQASTSAVKQLRPGHDLPRKEFGDV